MKMTDAEMLPWVGLDGFVLIQTIKLFLGLLVMLGVPALGILVPAYYYGTGATDGWYQQISGFSIVRPQILWFTLAFQYYTVMVLCYGLYIFYRNLSIYRQAFLRSPSCGVSQVSMRRLATNVGSLEDARKLVDLQSRSVVIMNVSSKYSKSDLHGIFEDMGLKDVSSIVIVQNRDRVRNILKKRNKAVEALERALGKLHVNMRKKLAQDRNMTVAALEAALREEERIEGETRIQILRQLLNETVLGAFRPRHWIKSQEVDSIAYYYQELMKRDDDLLEAARRFALDNDRYILDLDAGASPVVMEETESISSDHETIMTSDGLVSFRHLFRFKANTKDYGLTLWGTSMSIIVVFGSQSSATMAEQTLLSARPFSMQVKPAPQADDVIWGNLYRPAADRTVRQLFGDLVYVMINIAFTTLNAMVTAFLTLDRLQPYLPAMNPLFRRAITGILTPLFYNLFLFIAPYLLYALSIYQGKMSKSEVQHSLLQKYVWLLYIQTFILTVLGSAFIVLLENIIGGHYNTIIAQLRESLPKFSVLFTTIILQRAAISLMLLLLKPTSLAMIFLVKTLFHNNLRRRAVFAQPSRIDMGVIYPEYIMFVFMVTLAFLPLAPIICVASMLFYLLAYLIFRHNFIFTFEIMHESGGRYWMYLPTPILVGSITSQVFTIVQLSVMEGGAQALCMVPLLIITVGGIIFIRRVFERRSHYLPLGPEAVHKAIYLAEQMQSRQRLTICHIAHEADEESTFRVVDESSDGLLPPCPDTNHPAGVHHRVGERNYEAVPYDFGEPERRPLMDLKMDESSFDSSGVGNPYCNPIMFKRFSHVMTPSTFFHILREMLK